VDDLWHRSLLVMRSQIDNRGAIIASNDSDIMKFNKDTYTYMWPRDGALVSMVLSELGYVEIVRRFLLFCEKVITKEGFVHHKFNPDGSLGSSWHPKFYDGKKQLPIQEDESALILVALWRFYEHSKSVEVVQELFDCMVLKIGQFLVDFIEKKTGLPKQSYDLWEEQFGVFSYTAATTHAGLVAAAKLSKATGHYYDQARFEKAAKSMKKAIEKHLFSTEHNRFLKKVHRDHTGQMIIDPTVDASLAFVWQLGVFDPEDPKVVSTMQAIEEHIAIKNNICGIARYQGDFYQRNWDHHYSADVPGNPWIITTLWLANWYIAIAKDKKDLQKAENLINWVVSKASSAGILPEQVDPFTNAPLSVAPLTWSHATFVETVLRFSKKFSLVSRNHIYEDKK